jgi:hypothetical protein
MEKRELDLVTSICTMSCNVLLQDFTRHTRRLEDWLEIQPQRFVIILGINVDSCTAVV